MIIPCLYTSKCSQHVMPLGLAVGCDRNKCNNTGERMQWDLGVATKKPISTHYTSLHDVLERAFKQASEGKGKDRHAQGLPFEDQPMQVISNLIGSQDGMYYQAIKKIQESVRLPTNERKIAELLGAINYIAGAIINLETNSNE